MRHDAEYENGNQNFVQKIGKLEERYRTFRRTRGDGNCFFRGFIYAYLEGLLQNSDLAEANRCVYVFVCVLCLEQRLGLRWNRRAEGGRVPAVEAASADSGQADVWQTAVVRKGSSVRGCAAAPGRPGCCASWFPLGP